MDVGQWLLQLVSRYGPSGEINILKMDIPDNDALIWITATTLHYCWTKRVLKTKTDVLSCLSYLAAKARMLEETHHSELLYNILAVLHQEDEEE